MNRKSALSEVPDCKTGGFEACGALTAPIHGAWVALVKGSACWIERIERRVLAQGGMPLESLVVLMALSQAPKKRLRMGEIYQRATVTRSGLTRLVDRLEKEGWVTREVCPNDRRSFQAILTKAGETARVRSWPLYAEAVAEEFGSQYSDEEARTLTALLSRAPERE